MQSPSILKTNTISDVMRAAIGEIRGTCTATGTGGVLVGDFSGFTFTDNPANHTEKKLHIDGNLYTGCKLEEADKVSVPDLEIVEAQTYEIVEGSPFFFDGYPKDLNQNNLAYPAIILPRNQIENLSFGDAASLETEIKLTLIIVDYADHEEWAQSSISQLYEIYGTNYNTYIERPMDSIVRKLVSKLDRYLYTGAGGQQSTVYYTTGRTGWGTKSFIPNFGSSEGMQELGFDTELGGVLLELDITIKNSMCAI